MFLRWLYIAIPAWEDSGLVLSLHWLVVSFFALSFLFQGAAAIIELKVRRLRCRASTASSPCDEAAAASSSVATWLRFIEYSFSAAVMIVAIALQVGIADAWMLFVLAALTWATMMLGLVGERILALEEDLASMSSAATWHAQMSSTTNHGDAAATGDFESRLLPPNGSTVKPGYDAASPSLEVSTHFAASCIGLKLPLMRWAAHTTAWVTQAVVFVVIIAHFYNSQRTCEFSDAPGGRADNIAPDFVYAIVFSELGLFVCFGLTQLGQFIRFDVWRNGGSSSRGGGGCVEAAYIVQSLVSKTLLGWLVYGGNFA